MEYRFLGIEMQSPLIAGSGPLCYGAEGMIRLHRAGAGAVTTKTINLTAAENPSPHIAVLGARSLLNCEKWSDFPPEQWIEQEIPAAKRAGATVIASVGASVLGQPEWIPALVRAGAGVIELVSYDEAALAPMAAAFRPFCDVPMLAKLSANFGDFMGTARRCRAAGCDGFTACDSVGPAVAIDIMTGRPVMGAEDGRGWLSGAAVKPLILHRILQLRQEFDCPILGLGGIMSWEDCIEFSMAGANALGVCSAPMLLGTDVLGRLRKGIEAYLESRGYQGLGDICGLTPRLLHTAREFRMGYDESRCIACGRCVAVCPYRARALDAPDGEKRMRVDEALCRNCGLCVSVCPKDCLRE